MTDKDYEDLLRSGGFELDPKYLDEKLSWGVKMAVDFETKEQAEKFIEWIFKRKFN